MDVDLALLADAATVDASGKLNILGVFDRISASGFPARHGRITLILRFSAGLDETGAHEVEIRLRDSSGGEHLDVKGTVQVTPRPGAPGGIVKVPHVLNLDGIVFREPGEYSFDVLVGGRHEVSIPLTVVGMGGSGSQA